MAERKHQLVDDTLKVEGEGSDRGVIARCTCGWTSGRRFSGFAASNAFTDHQENPGRETLS